jgi:hypothetical protein
VTDPKVTEIARLKALVRELTDELDAWADAKDSQRLADLIARARAALPPDDGGGR